MGAQNIHFGREGGSLGNCVLPEGVLQESSAYSGQHEGGGFLERLLSN